MSSSDRNEILRMFEEVYPDNVRTGNLQGYAEMYTDDALWMAPDTYARCGPDDIVEGFASQIENQDIDPIFTAKEVEVLGDLGYVLGVSQATIYPKDGSPPKQLNYQALWHMKKQMAGKQDVWKISRQIWNATP